MANLLGVSEKYVLYEMSYTNLIMYSRAMPHPDYESKKETNDRPLFDESKDANEDIKITDDDEEEIVRR